VCGQSYWRFTAAAIAGAPSHKEEAFQPRRVPRLGFDPASASAPFVATLVDVTGLVIYFSVAFLMLRGTLL